MEPNQHFDSFISLIQRLRKDCPWDRKQTHHSIKDNVIEEAYEVVDAIDSGDMEELKKELGDLLLQVVFHSQMASETDSFTIHDVLYSISEKLIRRHPHVFGNKSVENDEEVAANWESIKKSEGKESIMDGLPAHLPALIKAFRMQEKASNVGFDWNSWESAWAKLDEELLELKQALKSGSSDHQSEEFGDLLFSMVNLGRLLNLKAEDSLRFTNRKFENRFRYIETRLQEKKKRLKDVTLEEMDQLWDEAKENGR